MKKYNFLVLLISAIVSIAIITSCATFKIERDSFALTQNTPFTIKNSYYQNWVAGLKEGDSGLNIYITIDDILEGVILKEFYFQDNIFEVKSSKNPVFVGYYKNETDKDLIMDSNSTKEIANIQPKKFPFKLENNEAVLSYEYHNKMYYYKISHIEEKQIIAYPSRNPNNKL
ncbi:MAG: hypothetical protein HN507_03305 [Flavobacteriaceae bacterium]|jgi:hypothetical protein|nr:hypothetical protein [Flavobacteriaceae bacterium]